MSRRKQKKLAARLRLPVPRRDETPILSWNPYTPEGQRPWMHCVYADGTWFKGHYDA